MKYLIVAIFALVSPISSRPQAPAPQAAAPQQAPSAASPQTQPLAAAPQRQPQFYAQQGGDVTPVSIISQNEVVGADGSFNFSYDTSNGIHVEQGGFIRPAVQSRIADPNDPEASSGDIQVIQGAYSYTAPDGQQISLRYVADENGFQPEGEHLPKAPPIPEGIARSLEQQAQGTQQTPQLQQQPQQSQQYQQQPQQAQQYQQQPQQQQQPQALESNANPVTEA